MKPLEELSTEELSRIRVKHAASTKKDSFSVFCIGQKKAVTKLNHDPLSKEGRRLVNEAKDRLCYPEDEGDLW